MRRWNKVSVIVLWTVSMYLTNHSESDKAFRGVQPWTTAAAFKLRTSNIKRFLSLSLSVCFTSGSRLVCSFWNRALISHPWWLLGGGLQRGGRHPLIWYLISFRRAEHESRRDWSFAPCSPGSGVPIVPWMQQCNHLPPRAMARCLMPVIRGDDSLSSKSQAAKPHPRPRPLTSCV